MGAAALLGALAATLIKPRRTTRRKSQDLRTRVSGQNPFLGASGAAKAGSNRDAKAGSNREAVAEGRGGDTLLDSTQESTDIPQRGRDDSTQ